MDIASTNNNSIFFDKIKKKSDKIFTIAILLYFLNGILLCFFYDTWVIGLGVGGLCVFAYFGSRYLLPDSELYQYVGSAVLAVFMAQFIYQMHGMFEMHFWAYVAATLLITYQNWKLFLPISLIVLIHHALFAFLQFSGQQIYFTQMDYMDLQTFMFHAALAVLIIGICAYWSYDLSNRTIQSGEIRMKLEQQLDHISKNIRFAEEISKGNLQIAYQVQGNDDLGKALLDMQKSLIVASDREKQERFVSEGISTLSELLRNNMHDLNALTDVVLKQIVTYMSFNQGAIYLAEEKEEGSTVLTLKSCYAYDRKKYKEHEVMIGEGLIGQAYLEKDFIYLTEVPEGYIRITSGLGEAKPSCILIMPLINNQEIVGIMEFASLKIIPEKNIVFIRKAAESIASTILSAKINARTGKLLQQAQEQAESLRAQEEEMRQNLEEMEATQEEMQRRTQEFENLIKEKEQEIIFIKNQMSQKS